ncbi:MAG: hypothetical protein R6V01_05065 [Thermoplasmatota archaeon]
MDVPRGYEHVHSSIGFPYQEALLEDQKYLTYDRMKCPRCGSTQNTAYRSLLRQSSDRGIISGDLEMKNLVINKCLNCGAEYHIGFDHKREA